MSSINKAGSSYIDGPTVNDKVKIQRNRWSTVLVIGITVGSWTD